jgi:hypothetical protein
MGERYKRQEDGDGDDRDHKEDDAPSWDLYLRALFGRALDEVEGRGALEAAANDVIDHDGEAVQGNVGFERGRVKKECCVCLWW